MAKLAWKGTKKLTVTLQCGSKIIFTISKVKGLLTHNIFKEDDTILKGGFLEVPSARQFLIEYCSNWK